MRKLIAMLSIALAISACAQTNVTYVPAVTPAYVRGQLAAATNATAVRARADLSEHTNSSSHLTPAQAQRISTALTNETDAIALAALATNKVTRWYASSTNWLEYTGSTAYEYVSGVFTQAVPSGVSSPDISLVGPMSPCGEVLGYRAWSNGVYACWFDNSIFGGYVISLKESMGADNGGGLWGKDYVEGEINSPAGTYTPMGGMGSTGNPVVSLAVTNVIVARVLYLPTAQPLYAETWSYDDMMGWMDPETGAGDPWVQDISALVANNVVNNHAGTANLHLLAGDRAKIDGAVSAVAATNIAASIVRPITRAETNVVVSSTNRVYYVALTNAATVSFDFSALTLSGSNRADIVAYIDCQTTQALYSSINTNGLTLTDAWEPTVTGRYELAVSSDGIRATARQTEPKQFCWSKMVGSSTEGQNEPRNGLFYSTIAAASVETFFQHYVPLREDLVFDMRIFIYYLDRDTSFKVAWARSELSSYAALQTPMTNDVPPANSSDVRLGYTRTTGYIPQVSHPFSSEMGLKIYVIKPGASNGDWVFYTPFIRRANALERAAYAAGSYPAAFRLGY